MKWLLLLALLLVGCTQTMPPSEPGLGLVRVILQTERSIQVQFDNGVIEVATAQNWPRLETPVEVCASFAGASGTATPRIATLHARTDCQ